jgi:hypothetical protein
MTALDNLCAHGRLEKIVDWTISAKGNLYTRLREGQTITCFQCEGKTVVSVAHSKKDVRYSQPIPNIREAMAVAESAIVKKREAAEAAPVFDL